MDPKQSLFQMKILEMLMYKVVKGSWICFSPFCFLFILLGVVVPWCHGGAKLSIYSHNGWLCLRT